MSVSKTYSKTCSAKGGFSYAGNFKLYIKLTDKDGSSSTNKSTVDYNVYCQADGSGSLDSKHKLYFKINEKEIISETKTITVSSPDAKFTVAKGSIVVTHDNNGSKSIDFEASVEASNYGVKASTSGSFALEKIPRYFSSKPEAHKTGKTETTYTIDWSTSETCSKVVFYMGDKTKTWEGSAKSGSITMTGLSAGTTYSGTYIIATRKDSGLTTKSTPTDRETYDYPHITKITTANLVVGDFQDVEMYNPIPRSVTLNMYKDSISDANKIASFTGLTSTKYSLKPGNDAIYKSIPNATSAKCIYTLVYGSVTRTASGTYTYKIKGTEKPTIKDFSISSTEYQSLTGDPKRIILGYSNVTATPSGAATLNNYAGSIKEYKTVIGNASAKSSSASAMTIANATTNRVVMSVTDSRGLSSSKTVDGIAVNYSKILISSLSAKRNNNINPQSTLSFTISFWNQSFGAVKNSIKQIYYEYKKSSSSSWIRGGTTISSSNYTISGNKITGSLEIAGDLDAKGQGETGFDINNSYNIRLYVQDQLSNHTLSTILTTGLPAIAIYGNKVSIGAKYDTSIGNALQVYGVIRSIDKTGFGAIGKTRTVGGSDYTGYFGIGSISDQGTIALELQSGTGEILNRIDITPDKTYWGRGECKLYSPNSNGIYFDQYGNIYTKQTLTSGNWRMQNGSYVPLKVEFSDNSLRTRSVYPEATNTHNLGSSNYYWKNLYSQSVISSMNVFIPQNGTQGYGLCNAKGKSIIRDFGDANENNVAVDATGGKLYLGYENTTGLNFLSGAMTMTSSQFTSKNIQCNGWLVVSGTLRPNSNNSYTLGNSSNYWSNGYINTLYVNAIYGKTMNANIISSDATNMYFGTASGSTGKVANVRANTVRLYAHSGGGVYLGSSGSTAVTSDENLKDIYEIDEKYIDFFNNLKPVNYIYKQKGHRKHFGFGARQVEQSLLDAGLTTEDFAGVLKDKDVTICADENGTGKDIHYDELYSLRYEEFVSLNTLMIQKALKEIQEIKNKIGG